MRVIISQLLSFYNTNLTHLKDKLLDFVADRKIFLGIFIVLIALASFSLGRLSKIFDTTPTFSFQGLDLHQEIVAPSVFTPKGPYNASSQLSLGSLIISTSTIVATKTGKKYYFVWCKGAMNLKEKNKIYFASEDLAKRAGKTLANNCR